MQFIFKFIFTSLLFFTAGQAYAVLLPEPFHSPSSGEMTVSDLKWTDPAQLPEGIKKSSDYQKWSKDLSAPILWFAEINVDDNSKTQEILIASSASGSGGRNFLLMTEAKKGKWRALSQIFGAPIFITSQSSAYADLQTYHRSGGDMWLQVFKFKNQKYEFHTSTLIPRSLVTECFYQRWLQLNLLRARLSNLKCDF
jgi:hypothetical protein